MLDWDLASLGPREMDLGWHLGLEFMMEALFGGRPPGFPGTAETLERYERLSGYEARDLAWHEVFALVRALAINDRHQRIAGDARRTENPMGGILLARLEAASAEAGLMRPAGRGRAAEARWPARRGARHRPGVRQGAVSRRENPMTPALATS